MALARQNSRPNRPAPNSGGPSKSTFVVIALVAFGAILGGRWLLGGAPQGGPAPASATAATPVETEPTNHTRRTALDEAIEHAGTPTAAAADAQAGAPAANETPTSETPTNEAATNEAATNEATTNQATTNESEPSTAAQPPAATPEPAKTDANATTQEAPKDAKDTTSPTAQPAAPRLKEPFFGNGFNAANPPNLSTQAASPEAAAAPADSPAAKLKEGLALAASEPVKARALLSAAMLSGTLGEQDARNASNALAHISAQLFLTPVFNASDTACFQYTVQPNDSLEKIVRKNKIGCDWRLVARLNNIKKPESIQVGKRLKLPKGPFSAVVSKRDYRIDICVGEGADRVIVASMPVGLGEANGTPVGMFKVKPGSKLLNPEWVHPVTGKRYEADDASNPIGEHWLGLEGTEEKTSTLKGYGIHGTVEPDSIGQNRSLGCVRLLADDVAVVWECLGDGALVEIRSN